ncbi:MAG: cytochrome b N-terminal domain-containing protein [Deltaproteobacteria bacterium]|nr:cytochrome b N-terminal domain-containing protein [Deltaproteobacteria bacterium]MBK8239528.1 cytochrome b N-terminal domain-containing protein [Deltaproteobacteria bacterium]MBK8719325.1 cytochrome b N-terminal domain-containing protein [Deltaproteobacteria bacterium]MBP7291829.1 cytochrome b N-terminal domain-containing protein [Nannocystaceae bacterium]
MSVRGFLDERLGLSQGFTAFANRPWPGGPALRHAVFAALVYLFVQQAVLGVVLAAYYSPSSSDAWASTAYLTDEVSMGWFIRGLHDHGASAFVVIAVLHVVALAWSRSYIRPRELMWFAALAVMGLALAEGLTGNPLPWDEKGYWAIQVELGIAEQTPGGAIIKRLVQGGSSAGNLTLLRLFVLHALVLPVALGGLLAFIAGQRRRHGPAPAGDARPSTYAPGQLLLDALAMTVVAGVLLAMTVHSHGTELFAPADPTSGFQARPEWYFLFLYKLRHYFEGPLEPIATVILPGAAVAFLLAAPLLERIAGKLGRVTVLVGLGGLLAGSIALTMMAMADDRGDESYQKALAEADLMATRARALAKGGIDPQGGGAVYWNDPEYKVKQLYIEHCRNCHALDGFGGGEAPDLTDYSSRAWLASLVRDPTQAKFFGKTKHDTMETYPADKLSDEQLAATVEYLVSMMEPELAPDAALVAKGTALWKDELDCSNCHEVEAGKDNEGPNLLGHGTVAWVDRVIRDSSKPDLFGKAAQMPKFEGKLSDEEIAALSAFVVARRAPQPEEG